MHKESNSKKRKLLEAMYIAENIDVNFKTDTQGLNIHYGEILRKIDN